MATSGIFAEDQITFFIVKEKDEFLSTINKPLGIIVATICTKCEYCCAIEAGEQLGEKCTKYTCRANELPEVTNYVTGEVSYKNVDAEDGEPYSTRRRFRECYFINTDGKCSKFKEKSDEITRVDAFSDGTCIEQRSDGSSVEVKGETDWERVNSMTNEDVLNAAKNDLDCPPREFQNDPAGEGICINCSHCLSTTKALIRSGLYIHKMIYRCRANPRESLIDPVTGATLYKAKAVGDEHMYHEKEERIRFPQCETVNKDANCPKFEKKPSDVKSEVAENDFCCSQKTTPWWRFW